MENFDAANAIQDLQYFGGIGGCKPFNSDSSTYTFFPKTMDTFGRQCRRLLFVLRHSSPMNLYLAQALAKMEGTETGECYCIWNGAITSTYFKFVQSSDHIVSARTIGRWNFAFLKTLAKFKLRKFCRH